MKKTVGILVNNFSSEELTEIISSIIIDLKKRGQNICIFTNQYTNLNQFETCCMPIGTMSNFYGDLYCFNSRDALLSLECGRDINIKYLLHEDTVEEIVTLFDKRYNNRIEYFVLNESYENMSLIVNQPLTTWKKMNEG